MLTIENLPATAGKTGLTVIACCRPTRPGPEPTAPMLQCRGAGAERPGSNGLDKAAALQPSTLAESAHADLANNVRPVGHRFPRQSCRSSSSHRPGPPDGFCPINEDPLRPGSPNAEFGIFDLLTNGNSRDGVIRKLRPQKFIEQTCHDFG